MLKILRLAVGSHAWALLLGLRPLTRAELARALDVTARTASQVTIAHESAGLVIRPPDGALLAGSVDVEVRPSNWKETAWVALLDFAASYPDSLRRGGTTPKQGPYEPVGLG